MVWIPVVAWIAAVVVAAVLLGYCAYEILWKAKRLKADLGEMQALATDLQNLRVRLADTAQRLAATGLR